MSYGKDPTELCSTLTCNKEVTIWKNCRADLTERVLKQISLKWNYIYFTKFYLECLSCVSSSIYHMCRPAEIRMLDSIFTCTFLIFLLLFAYT